MSKVVQPFVNQVVGEFPFLKDNHKLIGSYYLGYNDHYSDIDILCNMDLLTASNHIMITSSLSRSPNQWSVYSYNYFNTGKFHLTIQKELRHDEYRKNIQITFAPSVEFDLQFRRNQHLKLFLDNNPQFIDFIKSMRKDGLLSREKGSGSKLFNNLYNLVIG